MNRFQHFREEAFCVSHPSRLAVSKKSKVLPDESTARYNQLLNRYAPERKLYLAVTDEIGTSVFEEEAGQILIEDGVIRVVTFDPLQEEIVRWIP